MAVVRAVTVVVAAAANRSKCVHLLVFRGVAYIDKYIKVGFRARSDIVGRIVKAQQRAKSHRSLGG